MSIIPTITIGIPAYNEAATIGNLLDAVVKQSGSFLLEAIIVACDGCTDRTETIAREKAKHDPRIRVLSDTKRFGKAERLNQIYRANRSEFLMTLDADVMPATTHEIETVLTHFRENPQALVVAARQIPVPPDHPTLAGKIIYVNNLLWRETCANINHGDHIANMYGSATMLKKSFADLVTYPLGLTCDEEYLYMAVKKYKGFCYSSDSQILSRSAASFQDGLSQGKRFYQQRNELVQYFGKEALDVHAVPFSNKFRATMHMMLRYPILTLLAIALNLTIHMQEPYKPAEMGGLWTQAESTKQTIMVKEDKK